MIAASRPARGWPPPPIYLHFLDRELGEAFEFTLDLATAERALAVITIGTASPLICSMSALLENPGLGGGEGMIQDLVAADVLLPQSTHGTFDDFLQSRRAMYEHDQLRYPRYFGVQPLGAFGAIKPRVVAGSTTGRLHERLMTWTEGSSPIRPVASMPPMAARHRMFEVVARELDRRDNRAVTYAMFGAVVGGDPSGQVLERTIRQRISVEYTDHQRGEQGRLATGIGIALDMLERAIQPDAPFERDFPVLQSMLEAAGLTPLFQRGWPRTLWQLMLPLRGHVEHSNMVSRLQMIGRALDLALPDTEAPRLRRQRAIATIRAHASHLGGLAGADPEATLVAAQGNLDRVVRALRASGFESELEASSDALVPLKADVVLIVATDVEQEETLAEFGYPPGKAPRAHPRGQQVYLELGTFCGQRVFLVRSEMGAGGSGGSQFTADDAIAALKPDWVIMVGIAFGVDSNSQRIGDVLVPTEIVLYDHQRVGTEEGEPAVEFREAPGRPDVALLKRLRAGALDFGGAEIQFGKILSGSDLVDNETHRDVLRAKAAHGKAIGGEMELHGVFAAAERQRGRWIAAKAICDFADGGKAQDKASRQKLAAGNAARFVRHVIDRGLLDSPP